MSLHPDTRDEKIIQTAEQVAVVLDRVEVLREGIERIEGRIGNVEKKLDDHIKNGGFFAGMDKTTVVKLVALVIAALIAGSAGGQSVIDLIRFILGWGN